LPSAIIFELARREQADVKPADDGMYANRANQMDRDLATFQGAKNGQKIMVIEYEDPNNKPELKTTISYLKLLKSLLKQGLLKGLVYQMP
jgi:hypothetical protein